VRISWRLSKEITSASLYIAIKRIAAVKCKGLVYLSVLIAQEFSYDNSLLCPENAQAGQSSQVRLIGHLSAGGGNAEVIAA
jgi:hypothetical protein